MMLSILTPAVPSRLNQLATLCAEISRQIGPLPVEHLVFLDNKKRTVGEKRDALLRAAKGQYIAFVDDDDWIAPDYVSSLVNAMREQAGSLCDGNRTEQARGMFHPDVITFRQLAEVNGVKCEVEFRLGNPNEHFPPQEAGDRRQEAGVPVIRRNAWHVCAWRHSLAILSNFPARNYGEDWQFAGRLCGLPNLREVHVPRVLHYYRHDARTTEAPPPRSEIEN